MYPFNSGYPSSGYPTQPSYPNQPQFNQPSGDSSYPPLYPPLSSQSNYPNNPMYPPSSFPSNGPNYPNQNSMNSGFSIAPYPPLGSAGSHGLFDAPASSSNYPGSNNFFSNSYNQNDYVPPAPIYQNANNNFGSNNYGENNFYPNSFGSNNNYAASNFIPTPSVPNFIQPNSININEYPHDNQQSFYNPTVRPAQPFNPQDDAARLYKAMKGFGTDEKTLIEVLCKRPYSQRKEIIGVFKAGYGKDLLKTIDSETSGHFRQLLRALLMSPSQLQAQDLKEAIDGWGTDEVSVIDILCTKTNADMQLLKTTYQQMYRRNLEHEVKDDVSGYFKRFLISLMAANRLEAPADRQKAANLARELYQAGEGRLGTNEVVFNRIFALESFAQLRMVFEEYQKIKGPIETAIRNEMSSSVERAFLAVTLFAKNPAAYYAQRLYESMKGLGTKDRTLIRTMVLRSEVDMAQIKVEFNRMYRNSLESFIRSDTSGDYKKALLCLAGDGRWSS